MPYGLLRAWHSSISFFFNSATGTVSDALTNRLLKVAVDGAEAARHARAAVRAFEAAHRLPRSR